MAMSPKQNAEVASSRRARARREERGRTMKRIYHEDGKTTKKTGRRRECLLPIPL
jgi:hypothetical protein